MTVDQLKTILEQFNPNLEVFIKGSIKINTPSVLGGVELHDPNIYQDLDEHNQSAILKFTKREVYLVP